MLRITRFRNIYAILTKRKQYNTCFCGRFKFGIEPGINVLLVSSKCFLRYIKNILWFLRWSYRMDGVRRRYIYIYKSSGWEGRDHLKQSADRYVLSSHPPPLSWFSWGLQLLPGLIKLNILM